MTFYQDLTAEIAYRRERIASAFAAGASRSAALRTRRRLPLRHRRADRRH
jgi:hypothetical protein